MGADYTYGAMSAKHLDLLSKALKGANVPPRWQAASKALHRLSDGRFNHPNELVDIARGHLINRSTVRFIALWGGALESLVGPGETSISIPIADDDVEVGAYLLWVLSDAELGAVEKALCEEPSLLDVRMAVESGGRAAADAEVLRPALQTIQADLDRLRDIAKHSRAKRGSMFCEMA